MKSKELATTTKFYERVRTALSNEILPKFSLRLVWKPPQNTTNPICPSSIAKYFSDLDYEVNLVQTDCKLHQEYGLQMPLLGPNTDDLIEIDGNSKFYASEHELVEYVGMLALSCNFESSEFLNSWKFTGHCIEVGNALVIRLRGMFTSEFVKILFRKIK